MRKYGIFGFVVALAMVACSTEQEEEEKPFPSPQNLAQKVANVLGYGGTRSFSKEGDFYIVVFAGELKPDLSPGYILRVYCYATDRDLSGDKEWLLMKGLTPSGGFPRLFATYRIYDFDLDGKVDEFQIFRKDSASNRENFGALKLVLKRGRVFTDTFTAEERDLGEAAGVRELSIRKGKILRGESWIDAPSVNLKREQEDYDAMLGIIAAELEIK